MTTTPIPLFDTLEGEPFRPEIYRYFVADLLTDRVIAEIPFTDVTWGRKVSLAGEFSGTIPAIDTMQDLDLYWATMPGKTALYIMRGEDTVWGGLIWSREYTLSTQSLVITGASFESYLYRRYIWHSLTYANTTDEYAVARDLISRMQADFQALVQPADGVDIWPTASTLHIEVDPRSAGKTQDTQTWLGYELKSFGEVLAEYSNNLKGFEYNINVEWDASFGHFRKFLNFRDTPPSQTPPTQNYTGSRPGMETNIFEHPGNIIEMSLAESADVSATRYFVLGGAPEGIDTDFKPKGAWNNEVFLQGGWPLLEFVESSKHSTTSNVTTLEGYARLYGRRAKPPVPTWTITVNGAMDPIIGSYEPGDWCRIMVNDHFVISHLNNFAQGGGVVKRIMGYSVAVPTVPQKPETVSLELADEWEEGSGA